VRAPGKGTVAVNDVVNGSFVVAGTELATAYDLSRIYVTARVDENDIAWVHPGAPVEIDVDAFPHATVTGLVEVVQLSAAGNFTIYPPAGTVDPTNPHTVDQYIPVKIELTYTDGARVTPGMSVTVYIHKT
jgi:multidrug resistance efflux pump